MNFISNGQDVTFMVLIALLCSPSLIDGSRDRQKYGGRVLNIAPIECSSPKFPNLTGTCMISLECQQRSGTVIGACRDGLLFGACCHDPNEVATVANYIPEETVPTAGSVINESKQGVNVSTTEKLQTTTVSSSSTNAIPIQSVFLNILKNSDETTTRNSGVLHATSEISNEIPSRIHEFSSIAATTLNEARAEMTTTQGSLPSTDLLITESSETPLMTLEPLPKRKMTLDTRPSNATKLDSNTSKDESTTFYSSRTSLETTTLGNVEVPKMASASIETTTSSREGTTVATPTTKFFYGKIKYTPRPYNPRLRPSTRKTVWTRPPTTEQSYSVFNTSEEDDDENDNERNKRPSRVTATESITTSTASLSTETTTLFSIKSSEEATTFPSTTTTFTTTSTTIKEDPVKPTVKPLEIPVTEATTTTTTTETIPETTTIISELENAENTSLKTLPIKQSRLSNRVGSANGEDSYDNDSTYSASAGWDNKLDDFVNQVVEGIAEELDKSNIDDVVFKSTTSPTTTTTTTTSTNTKKPTIKRKKSKPKVSSSHSNKTRVHISSKSKGSKQNKKPSKKVTTSKVEGEHDVVLDYRKACGVRPLARQSRIVGGTPSSYGSWPWHALVKEAVWWGIYSKVKCGGVLIGARHVLTAAHCQPQQTGTLSVVLGVTDSDNPNINAVTKGVRRVIRHPQFNPRSYENDIAILELDSPVEFQPHIVPICLPDLNESFEGQEGYVTGMGLLKHDGERPLILHQVDVPILNNSECQSMFRRSGNSKPIKPSFICAGYAQGLKDSCGGDSGSYTNKRMMHNDERDEQNLNETEFFSGGPLSVRRSNTGQWVLAGTVSHGIKCAVPNQPGVYMRTTWYRPWIEKVTRIPRGRDSQINNHQARSGGFLETLFRVFRLARRMWKSRK